MNLAQILTVALVAIVIFANLLNPGGWIFAFLLIVVILLFYAGIEFLPEYVLVTNQGKNARKDKRRRRRANWWNPFNRTSRQQSGGARETGTDAHGGNDE